MDIFRQHEVFEIEVLERMKSARLLDPLIFGGGTMLRLCHDLPRYSADLDFWFLKKISQQDYFDKARHAFAADYAITDARVKHYTLLLELRSGEYPKRLKIEIRRSMEDCDFEQTIAFSKYAVKQVALRAHSLNQTMHNKIKAFLDRGEIRDCFDIEFLLRRGVQLPMGASKQADRLLRHIGSFKDRDYKVKLGSILEAEFREYYAAKRFSYLKETLSALISDG